MSDKEVVHNFSSFIYLDNEYLYISQFLQMNKNLKKKKEILIFTNIFIKK